MGSQTTAGAGGANTGGGGGGSTNNGNGGNGGSGIVILDMDVSEPPRHTITANGDAKNVRISSYSGGASGDAHIIGPKIGSSVIEFDGSGDYLITADSSDWDLVLRTGLLNSG